MRIALTFSDQRFEGLADALVAAGHEPLVMPLIQVKPRQQCLYHREASALLALPWLLFPSRSTVEAWAALGLPLQRNGSPKLAAVGPGTAAALRSAGGVVSLVGQPATATGLADAFLSDPRAAGPVGLPHGDRALPTLRVALEREGFEVRPLVVYETTRLPWNDEIGEVEAVVLASPSAVTSVPDHVGGRARLVAVGPTTAAAVARRGWRCSEATAPTVDALLAFFEDGEHGLNTVERVAWDERNEEDA